MDANPSTNSWCAWWGMGSEGGCSPPKNAPCWLEDENTELSLSLDCIDVSARFCFLTGERESFFTWCCGQRTDLWHWRSGNQLQKSKQKNMKQTPKRNETKNNKKQPFSSERTPSVVRFQTVTFAKGAFSLCVGVQKTRKTSASLLFDLSFFFQTSYL